MKRSDLKKILMQEVSRMLAEKDSQLPDEFAGMSDEEMKAAQATRNLSDRLRSMVKNYEDRPDEKTGETLKKVGIDPETPTTDQEVEAAAEKVVKKQPTGVKSGERPTKIKPTERPAAAAPRSNCSWSPRLM